MVNHRVEKRSAPAKEKLSGSDQNACSIIDLDDIFPMWCVFEMGALALPMHLLQAFMSPSSVSLVWASMHACSAAMESRRYARVMDSLVPRIPSLLA